MRSSHRNAARLATLAAALAVASGARAQELRFAVTNLGSLGGLDCRAVALDDTGRFVGTLRTVPRGQIVPVSRAFLWQQGHFNELKVPARNLVDSHATAINGAGQVAGWYSLAEPFQPGANRAFLWAKGELQELDTPGGTNSFAHAINATGDVAGAAQLPNGLLQAALWRNGKALMLGTLGGGFSHAYDVNSGGQVVGVAATTQWVRRAFLWKQGKMTDLGTLGGPASQANSINDRGDVTGVAQTTNGQFHAFLLKEGKMRSLGTLGGDFSFAHDNNEYRVVGVARDAKGERRAFVHYDQKTRDLNTLIPPDPAWFLIEATAINMRDEILCMGRQRDGPLCVLLLTPSGAGAAKSVK